MDTFAFLWQKETAAPLYVKMTHPPPFCPVTEKPRRFTLSTSHRRSAPAAPQDQCKSEVSRYEYHR